MSKAQDEPRLLDTLGFIRIHTLSLGLLASWLQHLADFHGTVAVSSDRVFNLSNIPNCKAINAGDNVIAASNVARQNDQDFRSLASCSARSRSASCSLLSFSIRSWSSGVSMSRATP